MTCRCLTLIALALSLPALNGCGSDAAPPVLPLGKAALEAVAKEPVAPREALARRIDDLFADPEAGETYALLALQGGRIVAERYGPGYTRDTRFLGWSMSKTITGVMIGMLISDGRMQLDESAPIPLWQRPGDPRGEITVRQLLQMRSGLRHTEGGDPPYAADEARMLFLDGRDDMAAYAEAQPLEAEPGRKFEYSSATSVILADAAAQVLASHQTPELRRRIVNEYLHTRLFEPLGMRSAVAEFDAAGTFIGSSMVHATARDWGKLGEFLRNKGSVRGAQVIPRGWIEFMTAPSPRNPGYGVQLWLNLPSGADEEPPFGHGAPASLFSLNGHLGQYVMVSPPQKLTLVRLGRTTDDQRARLRDHLARIAGLFPRQSG